MKPYLKTVFSEVTNTVDTETGELLDVVTREKKILTNSHSEFIQVFTSVESKLRGLPLSVEKLFNYCIFRCDTENVIKITSYDKEVLLKEWGLAPSTIANGLPILVKEKLLIKISRGAYRVNPNYVWKSYSSERKKMIEYVLRVECEDC